MRSRNPARLPALIYGASLSLACAAAAAQPAQTIYVGGDILTMKGPKPVYAQALAVRDGKIAAVGARDAVMRLKGTATEVVDPHAHPAATGLERRA